MLPVPRRSAIGTAAFLLFAGLALTGCDGGGTDTTSVASTAPNAHEMLIRAQRAVSHVTTFHVVGSIKQAAGDFNVNLHFAGPKGAYGSIAYSGISFHVVRIRRSIYFKAPANFYAKVGLATKTADLIANRWIKADAGTPGFRKFAIFTSSSQFFQGILASAMSGKLVRMPGAMEIGGVPAAALSIPNNGGRLYLALRGPALPIRIDGPADSGSVRIVDYGRPVTLTAPRGAVDFTGIRT